MTAPTGGAPAATTAPSTAPTTTPATDPAATTPPAQDAPKAPWEKNGTEFSAETAKQLILNLQAERDAEKARVSEFESKAKAAERASLSDLERAQAEAKENADKAAKAEVALHKYEVCSEKGVPAQLIKFVNGETKAELAKSADEVLSAFQTSKPNESGNPLQTTPKPNLQTGLTDNTEPVEMDPDKLAATIHRRW